MIGFGLATSGSAVPQPQSGTDQVVITYVSGDPGAPSGFVAMAVKVSGKTDRGDREYFIPFMTIGQAKPQAGQTCKLEWSWYSGQTAWLLPGGERVASGRQVDSFRCEARRG